MDGFQNLDVLRTALCESSRLPSPAQDRRQKRDYQKRSKRHASKGDVVRAVSQNDECCHSPAEQDEHDGLLAPEHSEADLIFHEKGDRDRQHSHVVGEGVGCRDERRRR